MKKFLAKIKAFCSFVKFDFSLFFILVLAILLDEFLLYLHYFIFIVLHEICHLIVAKKLGYLPQKMKLSFFGASLEGFDDFLTKDEIKIVLAGPLFNLVIVVACYLAFWFYPESFEYLNDILTINKMILLFNLIPIFPLDAGRLVLCFLTTKFGRNKAVKIIKNSSLGLIVFVFGLSIVLFAFSFSFSLGFACINLCVLLFESIAGTSYKRGIFFNKKLMLLELGLPLKIIYVKSGTNLFFLLKFIDSNHYFKFVMIDDKFNEIKTISEYDLMKSLGFI